MFSSLSVYLTGVSLIVLLTSVSPAQYENFTVAPDYDYDYNATFDYGFLGNTSNEDLDKISERYINKKDEEEDGTGGQLEEEKVTVTVATTRRTTELAKDNVGSAASLPIFLEIRMLFCSLIILISMNTQQLQHTL